MSDRDVPPILQIRGLTKRFGDNLVLKDVDFTVRRGEFVGFVGPNGAGKSTLIKLASGVYQPDSGTILLDGKLVPSLRGMREVGTVHQDLGLIDDMSVLDNLCIGTEPLRLAGTFLNRKQEQIWALTTLTRVGMQAIGLHTNVGSLSPGQKAMLAVARLLAGGAELIILDETTSTLGPSDSQWLISHMRAAVLDGAAVIMVSHKLGEITSAADRIVALVDGQVVQDMPTSYFRENEDVLVDLLAGEAPDVESEAAFVRDSGPPVLMLKGAATRDLGPIDLEIRRGQVLGITGTAGSGLHEVAMLAAGISQLTSGEIEAMPGTRVAMVPPQREVQSLFPESSIAWNMSISSLSRWRSRAGLLNLRKEGESVRGMMKSLSVRPDQPDLPIRSLSGGNQQKIIFARTMLFEADVLLLCEPTRGVDVKTRRQIYTLIRELRQAGKGVLITTSDFEDIAATCDQVASVKSGSLSPWLDARSLTTHEMAGLI